MSDLEFQRLIEASLQRPPGDTEKAGLKEYFERNPAARAIWEEETGLTRLLGELPNAPLSSNFTAQVMQALDRDTLVVKTRTRLFQWLRQPRPAQRVAWACAVVMLFAGAGYRQYHLAARARMAASVTSVAEGVESAASLAQLSPVELWRDFEPISRLPMARADRTSVGADEELLAALR